MVPPKTGRSASGPDATSALPPGAGLSKAAEPVPLGAGAVSTEASSQQQARGRLGRCSNRDSADDSQAWRLMVHRTAARRQRMRYGRDEDEWRTLIEAGIEFLRERGEMERTTSYTEFNAALARRTGKRQFDFNLDSERAAIGHLLEQISEAAYESCGGLLLSALVQYLDSNDAGPGFYSLAQRKGAKSPRTASARYEFWLDQVKQLHARYARPRRSSNIRRDQRLGGSVGA